MLSFLFELRMKKVAAFIRCGGGWPSLSSRLCFPPPAACLWCPGLIPGTSLAWQALILACSAHITLYRFLLLIAPTAFVLVGFYFRTVSKTTMDQRVYYSPACHSPTLSRSPFVTRTGFADCSRRPFRRRFGGELFAQGMVLVGP